MFSMGQFIPKDFLKKTCIDFVLKDIGSFSLNLCYEKYVDSNMKRLLKDLIDDESTNYKMQTNFDDKLYSVSNFNNFSAIILKEQIEEHLFLNSCMIEIYRGYLGGKEFCVNISKSLSRIKKRESITDQNFNFLRKYKNNSFLFPIDLNLRKSTETPNIVPMHFEDFLSYVLVNMGKADESPIHLYKYNKITIEDEDDSYENIGTFLQFCRKYYKYSDEFKFSVFSDYLFEHEYNHSLALGIMHSINHIDRVRTLTEEQKSLIELTLSFLSLLPLYSKIGLIQLFIKLGYESEEFGFYYSSEETKPFSKEWAEFSIKNILKLSFISFPVMEQVYYYLIRNNPFVGSSGDSLFITQDNSWYIDLVNSNSESINEINKTLRLNSTFVKDTNEIKDYYNIQSIISTLKTAFSMDIMSNVYSNCMNANSEQMNSTDGLESFPSEGNINLDLDIILKYIENILNGNMKNAINVELNGSSSEKIHFDKQIKASLELKELLHSQFNKIFHF